MAFRGVIKSFNVLNLCLIILSLFFVDHFLFPMLDSKVTFVLPPIKKKAAEDTSNEAPKPQNLSPMDYVMIADENLFHPERRIPPDKKDEAALPKPEFVLFGTLITPNMSLAYLEDKKAPITTPGRGKRQTALSIGETLSGFTLKEIFNDKVVMKRGEETLIVLLNDPQAVKTREAGAPAGPHAQTPKGPGTLTPSPPPGAPSLPSIPGRPGSFPPVVSPPGAVPMPPNTSPSRMSPSLPPTGTVPPGRTRVFPPAMP